jgi:hypothetical protein
MTSEEIKRLVLLRLESMPDSIKISIGSEGELTKEQLIDNVKRETDLGKLIVEMQMKYLRSMKRGLNANISYSKA